MISNKNKTFYRRVEKFLKDWAHGGYNDQCEADLWTELNKIKKDCSDQCDYCPYELALKDNTCIFLHNK